MNSTQYRKPLIFGAIGIVVVGCLAGAFLPSRGVSSDQSRPIAAVKPAVAAAVPVNKQQAASIGAHTEVATLAAGCFWSMEAIFKQLKGVEKVEPGYSGGTTRNPTYERVETGRTGHAETVNIIFDPNVISYHDLLQVYFTVRNPTTLNRQDPDEGTEYRSIIFYRNDDQKRVAEQTEREISAAHLWQGPIVTELKPFSHFYQAEDYHLNYYNLHPNQDYCKFVIGPEITRFRTKFADKLK
ncbi:MAG: peptide-methionine (S)-S-oxide reductase MsrA [Armatimonadota bacterium]|nr:peptide-methionine (S)-S-oxide reductase MsrA [Armatimonadota bacterium]